MPQRTVPLVACLVGWVLASGEAAAGELGDVPAGGFQSPEEDPGFSPEAGVKPLNNLVFELINLESPESGSHSFHNLREGWVYLRVSSNGESRPEAVHVDDNTIPLKRVDEHLEAMCYLADGPHTVHIPPDSGSIQRLEVRAIGELVYATYGLNPHIKETGVYTWDFLRRHCLDHYNSIIGSDTLNEEGKSSQESEIREWTSEGKRWFTREPVPYDVSTADEVYDTWARSLGMQHPLMSGIWVDEFGVGEKYGKRTSEMYPIWIEAIQRLRENPDFKGRIFSAYSSSRMLPVERFAEMHPFIQTLMASDYRIGPEWYLPESHSRPGREIVETKDLLAEFSPAWELSSRESFELASRGAATNRIIVVSLMSEPGWESGDLFPNYDFNVFLDSQLQFIATDPAFFGVRGLQGYLSSYCGEEQTRLFAKLVRHYAIEGNTKRFLIDPYVLPHLRNADLSDGTAEWNLTPADQQSITVKTIPGLGTLQAKYHAPPGTGDVAFWTRRNNEQPNVISQQLRSLTPGRLYSLRLITGDNLELIKGTSNRRKHMISVTIDNVDQVKEKSFQAVVGSGYWYRHGDFDPNNPYWMNYHQHVFRAREKTANLRLSDWSSSELSGGPEGEELIWNFIQVQPYVE